MPVPQTTEQLCNEMSSFIQQPSASRQAQIQAALAELLETCRSCLQDSAGTELLTVGAHHLNVACPDDQVDVLLVVPNSAQLGTVPAVVSVELEKRGEAKNIVR